jgi:hypothetical protein
MKESKCVCTFGWRIGSLFLVAALLVSPWIAAAQSSTSLDQSQQAASTALPDAPKPTSQAASENDTDKLHETRNWLRNDNERQRPWWNAFRAPQFLVSAVTLAGLTAWQISQTDNCIAANKPACSLYTRKNKAAVYAVNIPLTSAIIWSSARLKEHHRPQAATLVMFGGLTYQLIGAYTADPHVLVCQKGRIPECQ